MSSYYTAPAPEQSQKGVSPSWVRTSDLQVNSLTRYRLRHGGPGPPPHARRARETAARVAQWKRVGFRSRRLWVRSPPRVVILARWLTQPRNLKDGDTCSQSAGLEPARAEPSGFLVHPLNRLGTTAGWRAVSVLAKCHLLGLNQGPSDLQSDALPTELKRRWTHNRSQTAGLEPARAEPSGFRVHPLNRLGTSAAAA